MPFIDINYGNNQTERTCRYKAYVLACCTFLVARGAQTLSMNRGQLRHAGTATLMLAVQTKAYTLTHWDTFCRAHFLSIQQRNVALSVDFRFESSGSSELSGATLAFQRANGMDALEATGSSEDPEVRQAFSNSILHILRPLSVLELPGTGSRCDNGSDSSDSALSEPFSDLDESYILLDQRKKKPGKDEGDDMMLLNQFTSEFREVYDQLISEINEDEEPILPPDSLQEQNFSQEIPPEDAGGFSPPFQSFIDEMLLKCDLKYHLDERKRQRDQHRRKHRRVRKPQPAVPKDALEPAERDSLSGVWRMLDAVSEPNGFPITEGQYDLYEDERFEWLLREKMPWQRLEISRKKCEQWLKIGPSRVQDEKRSRQSNRPSNRR